MPHNLIYLLWLGREVYFAHSVLWKWCSVTEKFTKLEEFPLSLAKISNSQPPNEEKLIPEILKFAKL